MTSIFTSGAFLESSPTWQVEDAAWKADKIAGILAKNAVDPGLWWKSDATPAQSSPSFPSIQKWPSVRILVSGLRGEVPGAREPQSLSHLSRRERLVRAARQLRKDPLNIGHIHSFTEPMALVTLTDTGHTIVDYAYTDGALALFRQHRSLKRALGNIPHWALSQISVPLSARAVGGYSLLDLAR